MKINKEKMNKIKQLLQDEIADVEIDDVEIISIGYREYEVESYSVSLDADTLTEQIKRILEEEE